MEMSARTEGEFCLIRVEEPRIDAAAAVDFKESLRQLTRDAPDRVVLVLDRVDFIDSSGLGAIVAAMKLLAPERELMLAALTPPVDKVFRLTRMDTIFKIFATAEDALDAD